MQLVMNSQNPKKTSKQSDVVSVSLENAIAHAKAFQDVPVRLGGGAAIRAGHIASALQAIARAQKELLNCLQQDIGKIRHSEPDED